jgi:photosystem II stability/assembly factor-like uncharacterized protein
MIPNSMHPRRDGQVQTVAMWIGIVSFVFLPSDFPSRFLSVSHSSRGYSVAVRTTDVVSSVVPANPGAPRGNTGGSGQTPVIGSGVFDWQLKFSAAGKVFKDVSFASPVDGYLVTELGAVYRTTDGGETWQPKMNLGFPYYWYGVEAITPDTVIISGFNNQGNINDGVVRWSFDGGSTWSDDIVLSIPSGVGWLDRVHFFGPDTGIVMAAFSGGAHYTTTGGKDTAQWQYVQINPDAAWFAGNIDAQPSGDVYATGIHFAHSSDFGMTWTSMPSIDAVFDGGVDFLDGLNLLGLTGGGQISSPVQGWAHRTTDGGQSWSPRLTTFPYPIRAVSILDDSLALAAGGNVFGESGGIHLSTDGGLTWNLDVQTNAEMFSIEVVTLPDDSLDVWCAGSTGGSTGFIGRLYRARVSLAPGPTDVGPGPEEQPRTFELLGNYPNPFNAGTEISFRIGHRGVATVRIYDLLGREVEALVAGSLAPGAYTLHWDATDEPSGVYFYRLEVGTSASRMAGGATRARKMVLLR